MAYGDVLDPATPSDAQTAGQGDDRIRELKRAIIERLETVFADLDADPLAFINNIIPSAAIAALDGAKLTNGTVTAAKLAAGAAAPADLSITEPKLADNAVSARTLADEIIGEEHIDDVLGNILYKKVFTINHIFGAPTNVGAGIEIEQAWAFVTAAGTEDDEFAVINFFTAIGGAGQWQRCMYHVRIEGTHIKLVVHNPTAGAIDIAGLAIQIQVMRAIEID